MGREERTQPMYSTESGMVTEVSAVFSKAYCARNDAGQPASSLDGGGGGRGERTEPMCSTESGMVTEVRPVLEKASCARNSAGQPTAALDEWGGGTRGAYVADGRDRVADGYRGECGLLKGSPRATQRGSAGSFP